MELITYFFCKIYCNFLSIDFFVWKIRKFIFFNFSHKYISFLSEIKNILDIHFFPIDLYFIKFLIFSLISFLEEVASWLGPESESQPSQNTPPIKRRATEAIITLKLATVLDKCKISKNDAMHLLMAAAEVFSVDTRNIILNTKSIYEARKNFRQHRYEAIKKLAPSLFADTTTTIHWDGKLLPGLSRGEKNERLAIIITSQGMEQFLGVPAIPSSTGKNQAKAGYETLIDWSCSKISKLSVAIQHQATLAH